MGITGANAVPSMRYLPIANPRHCEHSPFIGSSLLSCVASNHSSENIARSPVLVAVGIGYEGSIVLIRKENEEDEEGRRDGFGDPELLLSRTQRFDYGEPES